MPHCMYDVLVLGTEFDHVTSDVLQMFKVKCQRSRSQREDVVCMVVKLLLPFGKSGSLNLIVMSEFLSDAAK